MAERQQGTNISIARALEESGFYTTEELEKRGVHSTESEEGVERVGVIRLLRDARGKPVYVVMDNSEHVRLTNRAYLGTMAAIVATAFALFLLVKKNKAK